MSLLSFPTLKKVYGGATLIYNNNYYFLENIKELEFPSLEEVNNACIIDSNANNSMSSIKRITFPKLKKVNGGGYIKFSNGSGSAIECVEAPLLEEAYLTGNNDVIFSNYNGALKSLKEINFPSLTKVEMDATADTGLLRLMDALERVYLPKLEIFKVTTITHRLLAKCANSKYIYLGYDTNDRNYPIICKFYSVGKITDIELKDGYLKPLDVSEAKYLTADNIVNHMLKRLGINNGSPITLTLGSTNLNKLTAEQKQIAIDKGWTLA